MKQLAICCPCGGRVKARGMCSRCYEEVRHSLRKFSGGRERAFDRDEHRCLGCGSDKLVLHHRSKRVFATLCARCHAKVHKTLRLKFGRMTPFLLRLWREQHRGLAEQLDLDLPGLLEPARKRGGALDEEQVPLFGEAA